MCLCNDIPSLQNLKWLSLLKAMAKTCFLLATNIWKILKLIFLMKFFAIQKKDFCDPNIFSGTELELKKIQLNQMSSWISYQCLNLWERYDTYAVLIRIQVPCFWFYKKLPWGPLKGFAVLRTSSVVSHTECVREKTVWLAN